MNEITKSCAAGVLIGAALLFGVEKTAKADWHLQTKLALFDRHYAVCSRWNDHCNWAVVEYIDYSQVVSC